MLTKPVEKVRLTYRHVSPGEEVGYLIKLFFLVVGSNLTSATSVAFLFFYFCAVVHGTTFAENFEHVWREPGVNFSL